MQGRSNPFPYLRQHTQRRARARKTLIPNYFRHKSKRALIDLKSLSQQLSRYAQDADAPRNHHHRTPTPTPIDTLAHCHSTRRTRLTPRPSGQPVLMGSVQLPRSYASASRGCCRHRFPILQNDGTRSIFVKHGDGRLSDRCILHLAPRSGLGPLDHASPARHMAPSRARSTLTISKTGP